jgi:NAD(P)-dependent dehydrogenase (short-subunit alcohol dehydrogenase family)
MRYFVTGATGFIGSRLAKKLLEREGSVVYFLVRSQKRGMVESLLARWGVGAERGIPVEGDLTQPRMGISTADLARMRGQIDHMFHLAAVYDLRASDKSQEAANVQGTLHALEFAHDAEVGCFHLTSSIAAAGLYEGVFREDMFEEAENLEHPYFRTKHEAEGIVRRQCRRPWRIYRPGIVVGDSRTGEMDKIDGPYYFFKAIQKLRRLLPPWMPAIGLEGGRLNLVPVDYVVDAMDHIAHKPGLDGHCFHLTDPNPRRVGDILNIFAHAGHAPQPSLRLNARMFGFIPESLRREIAGLAPVRRIGEQLMKDLGLPPHIMTFVNYPTRFDCREALQALAGTDIRVPPLEDYAWKLWDYWERHLDPELFLDKSLSGALKGKVVMITGGGAGIGKAAALKIAAAGARLIVADRDEERLREIKAEVESAGGTIMVHLCDLTNFEQCDEMVKRILDEHGGVDILVNNAGRSIRRSIEHSFDRFHDFERTMRLNYFGALRLTLGLLPAMQKKKAGHVINISSIGVLTNAPRFSAYVASKAAMDAFARCAASEFADDGIAFTTINMPLVRTAMTAPTKIYEQTEMLTPEQAADLIVKAILERPDRIATRLGIFAEVVHAVLPKISHIVMNTAYRMFPESAAALGLKDPAAQPQLSPEQIAFSQFVRGFHI